MPEYIPKPPEQQYQPEDDSRRLSIDISEEDEQTLLRESIVVLKEVKLEKPPIIGKEINLVCSKTFAVSIDEVKELGGGLYEIKVSIIPG